MGAHVDARTVSTTEKLIARLAKIPAEKRKRRVIAIARIAIDNSNCKPVNRFPARTLSRFSSPQARPSGLRCTATCSPGTSMREGIEATISSAASTGAWEWRGGRWPAERNVLFARGELARRLGEDLALEDEF
jgi:hypothetical protein